MFTGIHLKLHGNTTRYILDSWYRKWTSNIESRNVSETSTIGWPSDISLSAPDRQGAPGSSSSGFALVFQACYYDRTSQWDFPTTWDWIHANSNLWESIFCTALVWAPFRRIGVTEKNMLSPHSCFENAFQPPLSQWLGQQKPRKMNSREVPRTHTNHCFPSPGIETSTSLTEHAYYCLHQIWQFGSSVWLLMKPLPTRKGTGHWEQEYRRESEVPQFPLDLPHRDVL